MDDFEFEGCGVAVVDAGDFGEAGVVVEESLEDCWVGGRNGAGGEAEPVGVAE